MDANIEVEPAQVNRLDFAADGSDDDRREATGTSMSVKKPDIESKVSHLIFILINDY